MDRNGISKLDLKRLNRTEILKLITRYGAMSRIDIAHNLKLTRAAVTIITNEMIEQGLLYEKGEQKSAGEKASRGRKKILLDIHENYRFSFGVVIDQTKLHIGLANLKGQTLDKKSVSVQRLNIYEMIDFIYQSAQQILSANCLDWKCILGIGICVSQNTVTLLQYVDHHKEDIKTYLKKLFEMRFSIPVMIEGTTESLALAEMMFNTDFYHKPKNMVFIRYGYDVDAAIMLEDSIYKGSHNNSGWFPHLVVDAHGERCECGKIGCCITKMSVFRIIDKIKQLYVQGKTPYLYQATGGNINKIDFSIENLKNILIDEPVRQLYEEALKYLTTVLDNILIILDPDKVVLFGFVFEKILDLEMLNAIMEKEHNCSLKEKVSLSVIPDSQIHLAGNGLCVKKFLIDRGGFIN